MTTTFVFALGLCVILCWFSIEPVTGQRANNYAYYPQTTTTAPWLAWWYHIPSVTTPKVDYTKTTRSGYNPLHWMHMDRRFDEWRRWLRYICDNFDLISVVFLIVLLWSSTRKDLSFQRVLLHASVLFKNCCRMMLVYRKSRKYKIMFAVGRYSVIKLTWPF